jgi:hypothetical protein
MARGMIRWRVGVPKWWQSRPTCRGAARLRRLRDRAKNRFLFIVARTGIGSVWNAITRTAREKGSL